MIHCFFLLTFLFGFIDHYVGNFLFQFPVFVCFCLFFLNFNNSKRKKERKKEPVGLNVSENSYLSLCVSCVIDLQSIQGALAL